MPNPHWGSITFQRYRAAGVGLFALCLAFGMIEVLWLALGLSIGVDILVNMATYAAIPFSIIGVLLAINLVVQYKRYKRKVADGSIKDELPSQLMRTQVNMLRSFMGAPPAEPPPELDPVEKRVRGLVKLHPRMSLASLAARAGVTPDEIEDILVKLVSNGAIKGHVDPGTGDFISGMVDTTRVTPIDDNIYDCPHCGSPMKSAPVRGTTARCESCGQLIVVR